MVNAAKDRRLGCWLAGCLLVFSLGCADREEPIRQYTISKQLPAALESRDRMLGAIIAHGDQAWFYKLAGPADAVDFVEAELKKYIQQVQFADGQPVIGDLPAGWEPERQTRPMRLATLLLDTPSKQLELAISSLPQLAEWDEYVSMNVNRWREQMGLEKSSEPWAGATEFTLDAAAQPAAVWIDLSGHLGAGPSMAGLPSRGLPADHPPVGGNAVPAVPPMPIVPPAAAGGESGDRVAANNAAAAENKPAGGLDFTVPDGWRPGTMSTMRLAAFEFGDEDQAAELTVIQAGGDLRGNVARWLGEIRSEPPSDDVVDAAMDTAEMITVSGREAFRYVLDDGREAGDEYKEMTDATIVPLGGGFSMFIKARGPAPTVSAQHEAIGQFLESFSLPQ